MSTRAAALATLLNRPLAWERSHLDAVLTTLNAAGGELAPIEAAGVKVVVA